MGTLDNTLILFLSDNGASAEIMVRDDGHVTDIVHTILDLAAFPGLSLRPLFEKEIDCEHPIWYYHEGHRAIRMGDWKLVAAKDKALELEKEWTIMMAEIREVAPLRSDEKKVPSD
jgi:arylsulfatase A-like enzyme